MPSPGYKSPRKVKGLHSSGLRIVNVSLVDDITKIKKEREGVTISKAVGMKKKLEILKKAKELDVRVLNLNIDEQIKKIENMIGSKKKKEIEKKEEPKKETKIKESTKMSHEEKKEAEKQEKDKLLTKKV